MFIKWERGVQSAEKHPLSPPFLALSEEGSGLAYLSGGGSLWSLEVGSREID